MQRETLADFEEFAEASGYREARDMGGGRVVAIMPLLFTHAIIVYQHGTLTIDDRWCYKNLPAALEGLNEWQEREYEGEPTGWHRHPYSGRRRKDGDPEKEVVAP